MNLGAVFLALGLGIVVSAVEAFSRYRDAPFKAVLGSAFGWVYLLLNGGLSILAYWLLYEFQSPKPASTDTLGHLKLAAFAGLGTAAVLRSRTSFRMGKQEIAFDPGRVIDRLLAVFDKQMARARIPGRKRLVGDMVGLDFATLSQHAHVDVRRGLQGTTSEKRSEVVKAIREIEKSEQPDDAKVRELGFVLLDHMGEAYVRDLIEELRERTAVPAEAAPQLEAGGASEIVRAGLAGVSFQEASRRFHLLAAADAELGLEDRQELLAELAQIAARDVADEGKGRAVGFLVLDFFGREVFMEHFPSEQAKS